jgi:tyrosinase
MDTLTPDPIESGDPRSRNAAHQGPAFLPWHREFILRFERELQLALSDDNFGLPYWDWAADSSIDDPGDPTRTAMVVWREDFMGGQGVPVSSGEFRGGEWTIFPSGNLTRAFGTVASNLPTQNDVNAALQIGTYDRSPWHSGSTNSFRNQFEGWIPASGLHNRVHQWVGGAMMLGTSPNDPVFFLHHCNCDRIWALWQICHPGVPYAPDNSVTGAPEGHRLNDRMFPWTTASDRRISELLDISMLGYSYDDFHRRFVTLRRQGSTDRFVSDSQVVQIVANCDTQNDTASTIFLPASEGGTIRARFERAKSDVLTDEMSVNS